MWYTIYRVKGEPKGNSATPKKLKKFLTKSRRCAIISTEEKETETLPRELEYRNKKILKKLLTNSRKCAIIKVQKQKKEVIKT